MTDASREMSRDLIVAPTPGQGLPWWTWVAPLPVLLLATLFSLRFQIDPGVSIWYLPVPLAVVLVNWWGLRVIPAMVLNAAFTAPMWGLSWYLGPVFAMPELIVGGLVWGLHTRSGRADAALPDLSHTLWFLIASVLLPVTAGGLTLQTVLLTGDMASDRFWLNFWSGWIGQVLGCLAVSVPLLLFLTGWLRRRGWALSPAAGQISEPRPVVREPEPLDIVLITLVFSALAVLSVLAPLSYTWSLYGAVILAAGLRYGVGTAVLATSWTVLLSVVLPEVTPIEFAVSWYGHPERLNLYLDLTVLCVMGIVVGRAVSDLRSRLRIIQRSERRLRASEHRFSTLFDQAADAMYLHDFDWRILAANRLGCSRLGMDRDDVTGRRMHDIDCHLTNADYRSILYAIRNAGFTRFETRHQRVDGTAFPVEVQLGMITVDGDTMLLAVARDISERYRARRRQRLLIDELDHRVKNSLASVLSIAGYLRQSCGDLNEFCDRLQGFIHSMAKAHDALAMQAWSGADVLHVTRTVMSGFGAERHEASGPECLLPPRAAGPVALALHELGVNASKYGAWTRPEGRVRIQWKLDERGLVIDWSEHHGPPIVRPVKPGNGMGLIEGLVQYELDGEVSFDFTADGLRCRLRVPIATVGATD